MMAALFWCVLIGLRTGHYSVCACAHRCMRARNEKQGSQQWLLFFVPNRSKPDRKWGGGIGKKN
ncbi:hypothetical protein C7256_29415 [Enterocloster lavalensis]|nr:hypothetical protein C7256_29415 [Enterocloster lavalensis]